MKPNYITIFVTSNDLDKRVDVHISQKLKDLSRNRLKNLILDGSLKFNDKVIYQPSFKLKESGKLTLHIPKPKKYELAPQKLDLNIVYEDNNLIVLDKAAGIVVHPGAGNSDKTLVNALLSHCKNLSGIGGVLRPGVVHRIDKMTSGLLVFAKDDITHNSLSKQFKEKSVEREYNLLTWNHLSKPKGVIETRISRSKLNRKKMAVTSSNLGKIAITKFTLIDTFIINEKIKISHIKCKLLTGRTHQIRLHMSHIGNPIIGDKKYSRNNYYLNIPNGLKNILFEDFIKPQRHALHANYLGFYHPKKKTYLSFNSRMPKDFNKLFKNLSIFSVNSLKDE